VSSIPPKKQNFVLLLLVKWVTKIEALHCNSPKLVNPSGQKSGKYFFVFFG
jgi:hypothetical protein